MLKHKIFRTEQLIEWADPVVHLLLLLKWCITMTYPRIKTVNIAQNNGVFKLPSKVTAGKDAKTNVFNSFNSLNVLCNWRCSNSEDEIFKARKRSNSDKIRTTLAKSSKERSSDILE